MREKQQRYLMFFASPKRRHKAFETFYHSLKTKLEYTTPIASRDNTPEAVEKLLKQKGARSMCYVISPSVKLDQREMPLREALERLISQDDVAVVSCIPGRLAYYKAGMEQYILEKPLN